MTLTRLRVTRAVRATRAEVWEAAPDARLGKHVLDLPADVAARLLAAQAAYWQAVKELADWRERWGK